MIQSLKGTKRKKLKEIEELTGYDVEIVSPKFYDLKFGYDPIYKPEFRIEPEEGIVYLLKRPNMRERFKKEESYLINENEEPIQDYLPEEYTTIHRANHVIQLLRDQEEPQAPEILLPENYEINYDLVPKLHLGHEIMKTVMDVRNDRELCKELDYEEYGRADKQKKRFSIEELSLKLFVDTWRDRNSDFQRVRASVRAARDYMIAKLHDIEVPESNMKTDKYAYRIGGCLALNEERMPDKGSFCDQKQVIDEWLREIGLKEDFVWSPSREI